MKPYEHYPLISILVQLVLTFILVAYVLAFVGGWWSLSQRYQTKRLLPHGSFVGSGRMRFISSYSNVLRLGSDAEGLYLTFWPRLAHPPLFVPWDQVEIGPPRRMLFNSQTLSLGRDLQIPFTMRERDVQRLLLAAGRSHLAR
jgi:hypothetical protein